MNTLEVAATGPASGWIEIAEAQIDEQFGEGYAKANPSLIGAVVQAYASTLIAYRLEEDLAGAIDDLRAKVELLADVLSSR